jgi:hypothetical protein
VKEAIAKQLLEGPTQVEPFIDKVETSRRLDCGVRTLDSWMKRGLVPYYKISKRVMFRWSEVVVALQAKCHVNRGGFDV